MASFYAELEVAGHTYPVRMCKFDFTQATDERGRLSGKVRYGLIYLSLDVPHDNFLLDWGVTINKPLAGHVTFFETNQRTARETMSFTAGECVGYHETFDVGNSGAGAYVCHLTIAALKLELTAGGPFRPLVPAPIREYGPPITPALPKVIPEAINTAKAIPAARLSPPGSLSEHNESGKDGPGAVSSGNGDLGGVSYGVYQLASKLGKPEEFLKSEGKKWRERFPKDKKSGTAEFSAVWKQIAEEEPEAFREAQHQFQVKDYKAQIEKLSKIGLDVQKRSAALQEVVWSTAVQHGKKSNVLVNAMKGRTITETEPTDAEIINLIYAERGKTTSDGTLAYFKKSPDLAKGLKDRFVRENKQAIQMLKDEQG